MNPNVLDDYQTITATTAIYPAAGTLTLPALTYTTLGLVDEAGEAAAAARLLHYATSPGGEAVNLGKEIGDVQWYLARSAAEIGYCLSELLGVDEWSQVGPPPAAYRERPHGMVLFAGHYVLAAAAPVAGVVKKAMRDSGGRLTEEGLVKVAAGLRRVAHRLAELAGAADLSLAVSAEDNAAKLRSRRDRGVLGGSGDHR